MSAFSSDKPAYLIPPLHLQKDGEIVGWMMEQSFQEHQIPAELALLEQWAREATHLGPVQLEVLRGIKD
jgi:hypothetical protein